MSTYRVHGTVTVSCWTVVEAGTPEEAVKLAAERDMAEHHIDGTYPEDDSWNFDNDGTPDGLRAEEEE